MLTDAHPVSGTVFAAPCAWFWLWLTAVLGRRYPCYSQVDKETQALTVSLLSSRSFVNSSSLDTKFKQLEGPLLIMKSLALHCVSPPSPPPLVAQATPRACPFSPAPLTMPFTGLPPAKPSPFCLLPQFKAPFKFQLLILSTPICVKVCFLQNQKT